MKNDFLTGLFGNLDVEGIAKKVAEEVLKEERDKQKELQVDPSQVSIKARDSIDYVNMEGARINGCNTATTTSSIINNYNDCSYRLPCGLCKLTMTQCPNHYEPFTITPGWTTVVATNSEEK